MKKRGKSKGEAITIKSRKIPCMIAKSFYTLFVIDLFLIRNCFASLLSDPTHHWTRTDPHYRGESCRVPEYRRAQGSHLPG